MQKKFANFGLAKKVLINFNYIFIITNLIKGSLNEINNFRVKNITDVTLTSIIREWSM